MLTKRCTICGIDKAATPDNFCRKLDGWQAQCKPCRNAARRADWAASADTISERRRARRSDADRQREREWYRASNRKRAAIDAWRAANPERKKAIDAKHYRKNADRKKAQAKEWAARNVQRNRENMRKWHKRRSATDRAYRLGQSMAAYVYWCVRQGKGGAKTEALLGYTTAELMAHLERQFDKRMSWDNYGQWHVDHIVPLSSFNFTSADDPEFKACWALANLRPLWAKDNLSKRHRRTHLI